MIGSLNITSGNKSNIKDTSMIIETQAVSSYFDFFNNKFIEHFIL